MYHEVLSSLVTPHDLKALQKCRVITPFPYREVKEGLIMGVGREEEDCLEKKIKIILVITFDEAHTHPI